MQSGGRGRSPHGPTAQAPQPMLRIGGSRAVIFSRGDCTIGPPWAISEQFRSSPRTCRAPSMRLPCIAYSGLGSFGGQRPGREGRCGFEGRTMRRREFITLIGGAAAWPLPMSAQQSGKVPRIGFLGLGTASNYAPRVEGLRAGLRDLNYIDGKNVIIEFRWADNVDQLPARAAELARVPVDIIFASSSILVEPARLATKTIPIVFASHADPIGTGHVASLA